MKRPKRRRKARPELQQRIEAVRRDARRKLERESGKVRGRLLGSREDPSEAMIRIRGIASEVKRRLSIAVRAGWGAVAAALRPVASPITRVLLALVRIPAALVAVLLEIAQGAGGWISARSRGFAARVRPAGTVAVVAALAALALAGSQFVDYRGVAVGSVQYSGEVGSVAPAPLTDTKTPISAHSVALLGVAALALLAILVTIRGRWRFGRLVGLLGATVIAVSVAVDAPKGLDAGTAGVSYESASARLIEGFWAQTAAGAALLLLGPLLGRYVKLTSAEPSRRGRRAGRGAEAADRRGGPGESDAERRAREREERRRRRESRRGATSIEPA